MPTGASRRTAEDLRTREPRAAAAAAMAALLIAALAGIGFLATSPTGSTRWNYVDVASREAPRTLPTLEGSSTIRAEPTPSGFAASDLALIGGDQAPTDPSFGAGDEDAQGQTTRTRDIAQADGPDIRQVTVQRGDTFSAILIEAGADPIEAQAAVTALSSVYNPTTIREGQVITLTFANLPPGSKPSDPAPQPADAAGGAAMPVDPTIKTYAPLLSIAIKPSVERDVVVKRFTDGSFKAQETVKELKAHDDRAAGIIDGSLYLSAKAQGVPEGVIVDLIRIFSYDVDFQREVRSGDKFDLLFTNYYDDSGQAIRGGNIQYAELTLSGERKALYRFTTADDQTTDYFTAKGWSGKRMLMKTPIDGARITSGFGMRYHPILGFNKLHRGVDFGAPTGTPIMAAGNGVVEMAQWNGGYGRFVRIRHANGYSTAYGHMSRFARGLERGSRVRQGQTIGYVGTSGRSTGPHLHYEVLQANNQINPMGVRIPTGRNLNGKELKAFQTQVAHIDEQLRTLKPKPALVAQNTQSASRLP